MRHGHFGSEDDVTTKIYDKELYKKLLIYLKPYWLMVTISFILLMLIAAAQLAIPYITKVAVDNVILADNSMVVFDRLEQQENFITDYPEIGCKKYHYNKKYFLVFSSKKRTFIEKENLDYLIEFHKISEKVVIIEKNNENLRLLIGKPLWQISDNEIVVSVNVLNDLKDQGKLNEADIRKMRKGDFNKLLFYGEIFLAIILIQLVLTYFQVYSINYAAQHAMYDLRKKVFARVIKMPLSFFDKNPIGRLVTRVTNDVRTLDEMLSAGLIQLIQDLVIMFGILIMMLILNWRLALVAYSVLPLLVVLLLLFKRKTRVAYRSARKKLAKINATLSEDISGIRIIQLFNQVGRKIREFSSINNEFYFASVKQMKIYATFRPMIHSLRRIAVALILWFGLGEVIKGNITLGIFMAFTSYMDRFFEPIDHLSEKFNILQAAMAGAERIFDLMDKPIDDYRSENHLNSSYKGEIEFKNVWLKYGDGGYVLKDISFKVKQGEKIALVGHTGSGKTSIISLLAGLYPYQKGSILIDGKEIEDYSLHELRQNIGIVQQDVFLFSGTIKENIVLNNNEMSVDQIEKVANYVNVHDFITSLPQKYDDPVMERGATLSVGQRQLIAFARVLAYDPSIFVLDEATSNIDTETEILIQDALKKLMENRTSIIIAHRLSTIQNVDRIIVLHKGEIKESGNHQELLDKKGLYYDLYRLQYT